MAMASKEEVLDLYTRIIRGEEVPPATLQAAKAMARHYGIDTPSDEPQGGDVIIVDDIDLAVCRELFEKACRTSHRKVDKVIPVGNPSLAAAFQSGVQTVYHEYIELLKAAEKYPDTDD